MRRQPRPGIVALGLVWLAVMAARPALGQAITLTPLGSIAAPADTIELGPGRAYLASEKTLTIVDISKPAAPVKVGSYTFPEEIWSFRVVGSTIYAGVNFYGLGMLDVSKTTPVLRGSFKTPGQAKAVAVVGTRALVVDHMEGLVGVDVSNPEKPVGTGSFFLDGYARDVVAVGTMAYAVDSPTGLYVLDLSRTGPLEPIAALQSGVALRTLEVSETAVAGRRLAVLVGNGSLQIYDVSKPNLPAALSTLRTPGGALRVALRGTHAFVADAKAGVQVVDLSAPASPKIVASYATTSPARDVAAGDGVVLVATAESVVILRVTGGR